MGKHFGELAKIRGIIYYKLSQHEQKPFANAFTHGLPNIVTRTSATIVTWLPPLKCVRWAAASEAQEAKEALANPLAKREFALGIFTYYTLDEMYHHSKRKNMRDFMDEVDPNA